MIRNDKKKKKAFIPFIISVCLFQLLISSSCSHPHQDEYLSGFFQEYAPCGAPVYCYNYEFQVKNDTIFIITRLYNYPGEQEVKTLTRETKFKLPASQIREVTYFPDHGTEIYIYSQNNNIIRVENDSLELVDFIPIDFDPYLLSDELKVEFIRNLESLLDEYN